MSFLENVNVQCPCCWQSFELVVDCSVEAQDYIEDCEICCRPIQFFISLDEKRNPIVRVLSTDE